MSLADDHINEFEETSQELDDMQNYYRDHIAISDLLGGKNIRPFGDDPDYIDEFEMIKRRKRELEKPLFLLWQADRS